MVGTRDDESNTIKVSKPYNKKELNYE